MTEKKDITSKHSKPLAQTATLPKTKNCIEK